MCVNDDLKQWRAKLVEESIHSWPFPEAPATFTLKKTHEGQKRFLEIIIFKRVVTFKKLVELVVSFEDCYLWVVVSLGILQQFEQ